MKDFSTVYRKEFTSVPSIKREIVESVQAIEGVDHKRVMDYIENLGLRAVDLIVVDQSGEERIQQILGNYPETKVGSCREFSGIYIGPADIVVVNRSRAMEEDGEFSFTEGLAVHELAHASGGFKNKVLTGQVRYGFKRNSEGADLRGGFLEEAFADLIRGKYMSEFQKEWIGRKALSMRRDNLEPDSVIKVGNEIEIPVKYGNFSEERGVKTINFLSSSLAGYCLELLCNKNPNLFSALLKARNDFNHLYRVKEILDYLSENLFDELDKLGSGVGDIIKAYKLIKKLNENF